jgi:hypothetical protein
MKTVVLGRDVAEVEVRPQELLDEYRHLLDEEVSALSRGTWPLEHCACPGCLGDDAESAFIKSNLNYLHCRNCKSIYVSPRPSENDVSAFYRHSRAAQFWRRELLPVTRETRRNKLFQPRAEWLLDVVDEYFPHARQAIAVGYHNDLLIEELCRLEENLFQVIVTNSIADIEFAEVVLPQVKVQPASMDELSDLGSMDLFLAFDIVDRCADPNQLFAIAQKILTPGGLLLGTTTLGSGFDIQLLWEQADGIYPPERMNLLSSIGLNNLCERHGFEVLEFSTPGMFDVETVRHAVEANPDGYWPRFVRYLVEGGQEDALEALQEYLQRFRLSSFARFAWRKIKSN